MNQIYLVGRVKRKDNIKNYAGGLCKLRFDLQVDNNIIPVIIDSISEFLKTCDKLLYKDSLVGVKGSLISDKTKLLVKLEKITDLNNYINNENNN